jgi:predicted nucleotidyltransferase
MSRDDIIATLRSHEAELRRLGVVRLSLFGSVARGEAGPESDIDIAAFFDPAARLSGFDIAGVEARLSEILGREVDLLEEPARRPSLKRALERDRVDAF